MKKWIGVLISLFLIAGVLMVFSPLSYIEKSTGPEREEKGVPKTYFAQRGDSGEGRGESDPHLTLVLKALREKLDEWLKALDERIETEDITRIEVRFLEILRNILAWVREKIDAKIESPEEKRQQKEEKGGVFRETRQEGSPFLGIG